MKYPNPDTIRLLEFFFNDPKHKEVIRCANGPYDQNLWNAIFKHRFGEDANGFEDQRWDQLLHDERGLSSFHTVYQDHINRKAV